MNALKAEKVVHAYGTKVRTDVLKEFSIEIAEGEFVALMGPSGSGKSTFLHLAAGLLVPESGVISVGGREITAMSDGEATKFRRRHVGVVFQNFSLLDELSVEDNVALPVKLDRGAVDRARMSELIGKLGLAGKEKRRPAELSGGERQRVAIARALFTEPEIVLADEPTGNLDAKSSRVICDLLTELNRTEKSAILLVTHDPVVAAAANRVCFMKEGKIAASIPTGHDPAAVSRRYLEICE